MSAEELALMGSRWRQRRRELDRTQIEMAEVIGVTQSALSQYEKGRTEPKATVAIKAAKYLDIGLLWLMGMSDDTAE